MKKLAALAVTLTLALSAPADVTIPGEAKIPVITPVVTTTMTTNLITAQNVKIVWTAFSINYMPPAYTSCVYTVQYVMQDGATKREIPRTRNIVRLTEAQVTAFALTKGVDFNQMGQGIGFLLNEYLKTLVQ